MEKVGGLQEWTIWRIHLRNLSKYIFQQSEVSSRKKRNRKYMEFHWRIDLTNISI